MENPDSPWFKTPEQSRELDRLRDGRNEAQELDEESRKALKEVIYEIESNIGALLSDEQVKSVEIFKDEEVIIWLNKDGTVDEKQKNKLMEQVAGATRYLNDRGIKIELNTSFEEDYIQISL